MSAVAVLAGAGLHGRRRSGIIATFVVTMLASLAIVAGMIVSTQGARLLDAAADDASVAHLVLYGTPDALRSAAADPDVADAAGPFASLGGLELLLADETVPIEVIARDTSEATVERVPLDEGRWATTERDIVLDRSVAADLAIEVGDLIALRFRDRILEFHVVGTGINFTDCFYPQCEPGRTWVTAAGLERFDAGSDTYAQSYLRFADPALAEPFAERLATNGVAGIGGSNSWLDTRGDFLTLDRVFGAFVAAFGGFVLVVAAVIVAGSTAMRVVARRRDAGLFGALGATPRQVGMALVAENLVVGAAAAVVGWLLAGFLASSLQLGIGRTLGPQDPSWSIASLVVCVLVVTVLMAVATVVPARSAARRPVTDVLRDVPRTKVSAINRRTARLPRRLTWMGAQGVASRPGRGALAALAIAVAVVGSLVSIGFIGALDRVTTDAELAGDPWDVALVVEGGDRAAIERALVGTPGVDRWFSELERRSSYQNGSFLSVATGGDPSAAAYVIAGGRGLERDGEAIVGYGFMQRFGVAVGDRVAFLAGTTPIDVGVVGWYRDTEDSGEILRYRIEDLVAAEPAARPDVFRVVVADGADRTEVGEALVTQLGPSARFELLDTGRADIEPMFVVLRLVAVVLLTTAAINLFATLATSARESANLVGVQLALGFTPRQLVADAAIGGTVLGVAAVIVGVPIGLLTFRVLADTVSRGIGVGPGWMPMPDAIAVVAIAALAVLVPSALGALSVRSVAQQPASDLVRAE